MGLLWFLQELIRAPGAWRAAGGGRNAERGRNAISQGLIAVAAGDLRAAERATQEASRRTPDLPLTRLLQAQTAQLKGDRAAARADLSGDDRGSRRPASPGCAASISRRSARASTRRRSQIAEQAREEAPSAPWAARALLRHQTAAADWDGGARARSPAPPTAASSTSARRAGSAPSSCRQGAGRGGRRARRARARRRSRRTTWRPTSCRPPSSPAGCCRARATSAAPRASWKRPGRPARIRTSPTPTLHVRAGDSANDRLKRAETLLRMRPHADEGRLAVARAAIDARDFARAREVLTPVLTEPPDAARR